MTVSKFYEVSVLMTETKIRYTNKNSYLKIKQLTLTSKLILVF